MRQVICDGSHDCRFCRSNGALSKPPSAITIMLLGTVTGIALGLVLGTPDGIARLVQGSVVAIGLFMFCVRLYFFVAAHRID